jgi:glutamate racemase
MPLQPMTANPSPRIGIFDSGVGGLSVLRAVRELLPSAQQFYLADSGHAPYGEKGDAFVLQRSLRIAEFLRHAGCDLLVMACNTATAAAAQHIRNTHPSWPIVGVEPGIKPAAKLTRNARVGVMATTGTLQSEKFRLLAQAHASHLQLILQPCPGLAAAIEAGQLEAPEITELVRRYTQPLHAAGVDTVVLGCTHYPFISHQIQQALGSHVQLVDTAQAVARHTASMAPGTTEASGTQVDAVETVPQLWSTGDPQRLAEFASRWLDFSCSVHPTSAEI